MDAQDLETFVMLLLSSLKNKLIFEIERVKRKIQDELWGVGDTVKLLKT